MPPAQCLSLGGGEKAPPSQPSPWQEDKGHTKFCWRDWLEFGPATLRRLSSLGRPAAERSESQTQGLQLTKYPQQHRPPQAHLGNGLMDSSDRWGSLVDPSLWVRGFTGGNGSGLQGVNPSASVGGIKGSKPSLTFRATSQTISLSKRGIGPNQVLAKSSKSDRIHHGGQGPNQVPLKRHGPADPE